MKCRLHSGLAGNRLVDFCGWAARGHGGRWSGLEEVGGDGVEWAAQQCGHRLGDRNQQI